MIMCSRFDTIPACDGQTDRQTSCYSICAMHNVARKKTTSYERLSLTGTAGFGLNESLTKLSTSFAPHSHDNSEREIQAFSAVSYIYCLQPSVSDHLKSERKTSIATSVFSHRFNNACLHEFRVHFYVIVLPMNSIASTSVSLLFSRHSKIHCDNDATP